MGNIYDIEGQLYKINQLAEMLKTRSENEKKEIIDILNIQIIEDILRTSGKHKMANKMLKLKNLKEKTLGNFYTNAQERQQIRNKKRYEKKVEKYEKNSKYKINLRQAHFGLEKLIRETIGFRSDIYIESANGKLRFIDVSKLTEECCYAIAKNFIRVLKGKEIIEYNGLVTKNDKITTGRSR